MQPLPHPGISNVQNYLTFDAGVSVTAMLARLVRLEAGVGLTFDQSHIITFANPGGDLPRCEGAETLTCEPEDNTLVTPGTAEVNVFHAPVVDVTGHRYRVSEVSGLLFSISAEFVY